jgi:hypothetical protein
MKSDLLIYTFFNLNGLTFKVLRNFKTERSDLKKLYIRGERGEKTLVNTLLQNNYKYVLGLGDYRKDAKRIRIEAKFINKYGKGKISETGLEFYNASWKLKPLDDMYISDKPSWGPCNRSAYKAARCIDENNLETKVAFVHVPRKLEQDYVLSVLAKWIDNLE